MKQFYTHLVEIESIIVELDKMGLSEDEKIHLADLVDSSLHHTILDAVLSHLKEEDRLKFIEHLNDGNHDKVWKFLNEKVDHIEEKIKKASDDLKKEFANDLKEARQRRSETRNK